MAWDRGTWPLPRAKVREKPFSTFGTFPKGRNPPSEGMEWTTKLLCAWRGGARAPDVRRSRAACPPANTEAAVTPDAVAGARCVVRRAERSLPSALCRVPSTESSEEGVPVPGFPTSCMDGSGVYAAPGMGSRTARAAGELGEGSAAASSSQRCVLEDSGGLVSMSALRCSSHGRACPPPRLFFLSDSTKGCISSSIQQRQRFSEG